MEKWLLLKKAASRTWDGGFKSLRYNLSKFFLVNVLVGGGEGKKHDDASSAFLCGQQDNNIHRKLSETHLSRKAKIGVLYRKLPGKGTDG